MSHYHQRVSFAGPAGTLSGTLQIPRRDPRGAVLLSHCFTCSQSLKVTRHLATGIEDGGYAVLRYDFTGLGESDGDFADTSVTHNIADIEAAARYLESRDLGPLALVGHSLGGAATLLAVDRLPSVQAVVAVAAPFRPDHVAHLFDEADVRAALDRGRIGVRIAGRRFEIAGTFFEDLERHASADRIAGLGRPLLVVHGPPDTVVPVDEGLRIFAAAKHPKWFAGIPDADHLFTHPGTVERATQVIVTFLDAVMPGSDG